MNIDPNYEHLSKIFLELLSKNNEFKNAFQAFAPDIYADIESASTNSNCSCRGRVENYVNSNREKCATFYNQLSEEIKSLVNLKAFCAKIFSLMHLALGDFSGVSIPFILTKSFNSSGKN